MNKVHKTQLFDLPVELVFIGIASGGDSPIDELLRACDWPGVIGDCAFPSTGGLDSGMHMHTYNSTNVLAGNSLVLVDELSGARPASAGFGRFSFCSVPFGDVSERD